MENKKEKMAEKMKPKGYGSMEAPEIENLKNRMKKLGVKTK